jgi:rhodanese-related sulfurtransferase
MDGNFAMWVGEMIADIKQPILLIADPGKEVEALIRLSRVGYDQTIGYLDGGFESWKKSGKPIETIKRITAEELKSQLSTHAMPVIDVRKKSEFDSEHMVGAVNIPMNELYKRLDEIPKDQPFILHCAGGYRSMIAASILKQLGWNNFTDVTGGFSEIKRTQLPVTEYVCPSTLL